MSFIVATNIVASWHPEPRPAEMPHAHANHCPGSHPKTECQSLLYPNGKSIDEPGTKAVYKL